MKFLFLILYIFGFMVPVFANGHKKYLKDDFEKIKIMKIEYLNKKINCINVSKNFREMKRCWGKKKY